MSTTGAQRDRWKQATQKELQAFLMTAWERSDSRVACSILCEQEEGRHAALGVQFETHDS